MSELLKNITRETVRARGLPGEVFKNPDIYRKECDHIYRDGWISIACAQQLKNVGDLLPVDIAGHPLLVLRDKNRQIRVFHNVCRHRAAPLAEEACNKPNLLICPYHRWAYQLDGSLQAAPYFHGKHRIPMSDAEKSDKGLLPVRFVVWWDIVFVNISGDAEAFDEFIAPLNNLLEDYDNRGLQQFSSTDYAARANWKLVADNFLDNYHVPFVHSQACPPGSILEQEDLLLSADIMGLRLPNGALNKPEKTSRPIPGFSGLDESKRGTQQWFCIFPNTLFFVDPVWVQTIIVKPQSETRSTETLSLYVANEEAMSSNLEEERTALHQVLNEVNEQDIALLNSLQMPRSSKAADLGSLNHVWDKVNATFQSRWLEKIKQ